MSYVKKNTLLLYMFKVAGRKIYVAASGDYGAASEALANARIGDVFGYVCPSEGTVITSTEGIPYRLVTVCQGGTSQYGYNVPHTHGVIEAHQARVTRDATCDEDPNDPCDGQIVEIMGQKYKMTKVK